ncbi:MAG: metal-dependent hydrolase [Pseudomonadales bacterium]|nr:metal-dependent hydrolase [Pseudomonadales bacterium]
MDPVTQGVLGATLAQATADHRRLRACAIAGLAGGLAPDLDIFIRSATDPLLYLEFHRQFTHALVFIPIGAGLCALLLQPFLHRHLSWRDTYLSCLLGYATHGLLDACTSYGTQLFWPMSTLRVSWNWISVVDPLFTLPLLILLGIGLLRRRPMFAKAGLIWAALYMCIGFAQHERAVAAAERLAHTRGHQIERLNVKPGFANLLLWKAVYRHDGRYYVAGLRIAADTSHCGGADIEALDTDRALPWLVPDSQQARDLERFRWYSDGWLALDPEEPLYIVDVRYSSLPNTIDALWGLKLDTEAGPDRHATYHVVQSRRTEAMDKLLDLLRGSACRNLPPA